MSEKTTKCNIKLSAETNSGPFLNRSDRYKAKELSQSLLSATYRGYNHSIEPFLIMGLAVTAPFRNKFLKEIRGFTVAYLYGPTSAGKTNLLNNIAYLYGYDENFIFSGESTICSMWRNLDSYNSIPTIYDEISRKVVNDSSFEGLIKSAYQGTNRDKISKIKTSVNATLIMSSNFQPPQRPEILNRLLLCDFEQNNFKIDEIVGFNEIRENYLSNLLPAVLKYKSDKVIEIFTENRAYIKKLNSNLKDRSINNIAIAYTGYQMLVKIAEASQPEIVITNFEKFVNNYHQSLKVESPWEEFLKSLPLLARNKAIISNKDYKYAYDRQEGTKTQAKAHMLCVHFEQAYKAFSMSFRQIKRELPPSQKELLSYAKNDPNVFSGKTQITRGINIAGIKKRCLFIDVRDNDELCLLDRM